MKTVILRNLNKDDTEAIEFLKKETGANAASKAIVVGIHSYLRLHDMYKRKCMENEQLKRDINRVIGAPEIVDALDRLKKYK